MSDYGVFDPKTMSTDRVDTDMSGNCSASEPFALRVLGDSMAPEFKHGVIIIVDPSAVVEDGSYVVAKHEEEYLLRQLRIEDGNYYLVALQEDNRRLEISGIQDVVGVVVQRAGRRRSQHKHYL